MSEKIIENFSDPQDLSAKFLGLDDNGVAHGTIARELFLSGSEGEEEVKKRIEEIGNEAVKNDARFNYAKLYYETKHDLNSALNQVSLIGDQKEQTRCLVHLALAVLRTENNPSLADEIVAKATADKEGYLDFYKKEKEKFGK